MKKHLKTVFLLTAVCAGMYISAQKPADTTKAVKQNKNMMLKKIKELNRKIEKSTSKVKETLQKERDKLQEELNKLKKEIKEHKANPQKKS